MDCGAYRRLGELQMSVSSGRAEPKGYAVVLALSLVALAGCVAIEEATPAPAGETITYKTSSGPFCGRCDAITIVADSGGRVRIEEGHWAGRYRDWRTKRRTIQVSAEQIVRFRETLAPWRPAGELILAGPACQTYVPDADEIDVTWHGGGDDARLHYDFGCDAKARSEMAKALRAAPAALGL